MPVCVVVVTIEEQADIEQSQIDLVGRNQRYSVLRYDVHMRILPGRAWNAASRKAHVLAPIRAPHTHGFAVVTRDDHAIAGDERDGARRGLSQRRPFRPEP
jgi:hypothetical protein